jgi:hypothetical protein
MRGPEADLFATPADFRAWLEAHHESVAELWVGFHKRGSGKPSITWPESVDAALCYGWISGVRKSLDENRYVIRFTPRKHLERGQREARGGAHQGRPHAPRGKGRFRAPHERQIGRVFIRAEAPRRS